MRTVQRALGPSIDAQQGLVAFVAFDRLEVAVGIDHLAGLVVGTVLVACQVLVACYLEDLVVDQTFVVAVDTAVHNQLDLVAGIVHPEDLAVGTVLVAYCLEDLVGIDLEEAFVD